MILPLKTDNPLRGIPWANWAIIGLNVLMFALKSFGYSAYLEVGLLNGRDPRMYQFVTYAFLHADIWHLLSNMLFLYIFGNNICDKLGNLNYILFYLASAIFAGVGYALFNDTRMLGASGAVSAVTGAYLALMPRSHITILWWFLLITVFEIPSLWFILAFFVQDVYFNFTGTDNTAHLAHISGSIFGFLVCMGLLWTRLLPRDHFDMLALWDRWNRRRQYQSVVREGYDPFAYVPRPTPGQQPAAPPPVFEKTQEMRAQISESLARGNLDEAAGFYLQLRQLDPTQTLSRGAQLDVASHLFNRKDYRNAADAWELFLKNYRNSEQASQVLLMLGLTYARYLNLRDKARETLLEAIRVLQTPKELDLAKAELLRLDQTT